MVGYRVIRWLFRLLAAPLFRLRVERSDRVPRSGPAIVVAPHRSWLDPACVGGACPRPVRFLILDTVYNRRSARWFYRLMRAVPIRQGGGGSISALREALRLLEAGELVGVFPEGRVVPAGGTIHPGAALLAVRARVPVIPLMIWGSDRAWPHGRAWPGPGRVRVRVGRPIAPPAATGRESVRELGETIERAFSELARGDGET